MKKYLLITFLAAPTFANETCQTDVKDATVEEQLELKTDVPNHLKGATIIIRTADGRESQVPAEKFKVVPRKQQFIVTKTKQETVTTCQGQEQNKNRISAHGGMGPKEGLKRTINGSTVSVESKVGAIGGLQYQRLITDSISVGGQVQTNKSVLLGVGLDF